MTELDLELYALGERSSVPPQPISPELPRQLPRVAPGEVSRRLAVLVAVLAIGVTGVAIAADQLIRTSDVAQSMPAGTLALAGTQPTCTVVTDDVEFHCVLAKAPAAEVTDAHGNPAWKGTVEPSVDAEQARQRRLPFAHQDGREWECYIGQAAVDQKIIGQSLLGEFAPAPGVG